MKYHAIIEIGSRKHYFWNRSKESMFRDVIIPYIVHDVTYIKKRDVLINLGAVSHLTIFKSKDSLKRSSKSRIPLQLKNRDLELCTEEIVHDARIITANRSIRSLLRLAFSQSEHKIFVIMKFGDEHFDSAYEGVFKPLGEEFGYKVIRVDEILDSGLITEQILENIASSEIIIADLSGDRVNCYYEAGFAQALGKEIIFTIRKDEKPAFDLSGYRFIKWSTEAGLRRELRKRLNTIKEKV